MNETNKKRVGLEDLIDIHGNEINLSDFATKKPSLPPKEVQKTKVTDSLPTEYKGKNWDELFITGDLEKLKNKHPEHYEKLRAEKLKNIH